MTGSPEPRPILTQDPGMARLLDTSESIAASHATVLITGESGTGKGLFARAIHELSPRREKPVVKVNAAALTETLPESELFGHVKGAFTGAVADKVGRFEAADGGTIFLDEIGDMKPGLQAKLLRFIENKIFRRVGGHRDISVDVRIVAATNRDLDELVRTGRFREDLFFRLNVIPIRIPPLRERRQDILPLAEHFLSELSNDIRRSRGGFSDLAKRQMTAYDWPGNVRELRNIVERALILGAGEVVERLDLPVPAGAGGSGIALPGAVLPVEPLGDVDDSGTAGEVGVGEDPRFDRSGVPLPGGHGFRLPEGGVVLEDVEQDFLRQALEATQGNQTKAAYMLGLTRDALRYRMKKFGLLS